MLLGFERFDHHDTIAAIATPLGEGAIGIVRMSGSKAQSIAEKIFEGKSELKSVPSHRLTRGRIVGDAGETIDDVLICVMRAPGTYTGEDVVEIHCHGGRFVVEQVFRRTLDLGARPAEPGEFTKRAFLNGRLDLAQAEAVIDVVRAKSPRGLEVAANQLSGRLSEEVSGLRGEILDLLSHIQATIDYPEEDLVEVDEAEAAAIIDSCLNRIEHLLAGADAGRLYRDGMKVAIVGRPNVGKSSLLNALLKEERAIVTQIAGTTRDVIEERAILGGVPFTLADTAGLRVTDDPVERIGVERTKEAVRDADLAMVVLDGSEPLSEDDRNAFNSVRKDFGGQILIVVNKADLPKVLGEDDLHELAPGVPTVWVSAQEGQGLEALAESAVQLVLGDEPPSSDAILVAKERHRQAIMKAQSALEEAQVTLEQGFPLDLLSVDLQRALESLGEVTGENVAEDVVAEIFARFCVGK